MTTVALTSEQDRSPDVIVGEAIHLAMRRRGWSQAAMAQAIGVHETTLGKKLQGHRRWYLWELQQIATSLGVDVATLLVGLPRLDSNQQPSGYVSSLLSTGAVVPIEAGKRLRHALRPRVARLTPAPVVPLQG